MAFALIPMAPCCRATRPRYAGRIDAAHTAPDALTGHHSFADTPVTPLVVGDPGLLPCSCRHYTDGRKYGFSL